MERPMSVTRLLPILAAQAILAACSPDKTISSENTVKMSTPSPRIEKLFAETKPICFGRFLIDVPVTAQVIWGPTDVEWTITTYPKQAPRISGEINEKVRALKEEKHVRMPSSYVGTFDGANPQSKIVVGYASFEDSYEMKLHSYISLNPHAFVQTARSLLTDNALLIPPDPERYKATLSTARDIAARLRVREETEVPAEPGICLDSGFVAESDGKYYELVSVGFRFPEYPDVSFSVMSIKSNRVNRDDSLEAGLKEAKAMAEAAGEGRWYSKIKTLRHADRTVGGWEGAEKLALIPPQPGEKGKPWYHEFVFKSIGVANDIFHPYVNMEMSTSVEEDSKGEAPPSLKDDEAVALWDKLTGSIRPRPVSAPPASSAQPSGPARPQPSVPLGTIVPSLQRCPQTGEWECAAMLAAGLKRRYYREGMTFPEVIVLRPERSLLQKIKGAPPNMLAETTWTLVSYDMPKPDESGKK